MVRRTTAPDPSTFPTPAVWATWISHRDPQFKTHNGAGQCKNSISGKAKHSRHYTGDSSRIIPCDAAVYRWDMQEERWIEYAYFPKDSDLNDSWFYQEAITKEGPKPVPQKAIDEAIASIQQHQD